jgi:hypothetical protein
MVQASQKYEVDIYRVSFQGAVAGVRQFSVAIALARSGRKQRELIDCLLEILANNLVPERPGRREPRAVKRRPKPFPNLNQPRHRFKDVSHANRNWNNKPRKIRA